MEGHLKIFVLKELSKDGKTGYELMEEFKEITSHKPSPGSVYPLLKSLVGNGLVSYKKAGRKKVYSLSDKGRKTLANLAEERRKVTEKSLEIFDHVYAPHDMARLRKMFSAALDKKSFFEDDYVLLNILKLSILNFVASRKYEKNREKFRQILKNTIAKINGLNR